MDDHQRSAIERTRIAWHEHQFEHDCYGRDCAEDHALYYAYQRAIQGDLAEPGGQPRRRAGRLRISEVGENASGQRGHDE